MGVPLRNVEKRDRDEYGTTPYAHRNGSESGDPGVLHPFLFGLLIAGITGFLMVIGGPSQIGVDSPWHNLAIPVSVISLFALVWTALATARNRLALWSYTWVGTFVVGLDVSVNLVLDDRVFAFSKKHRYRNHHTCSASVSGRLLPCGTDGMAAHRVFQYWVLRSIGIVNRLLWSGRRL